MSMTSPVSSLSTAHSMGRPPASSSVLKKIGAMLLPMQTPPVRLLGMKGMSSPMCHCTELAADLREEPVPRTSQIGRAQSELQSRPHLVCRLLLEKKNNNQNLTHLPVSSKFDH